MSALQRLIDSPDIPNATRKKLRKQASAIARKLPTAAGTGKKAQKAKKQVTKGLKALNKTIGKARAKIPSETFTQLGAAATRFSSSLRRTLRPQASLRPTSRPAPVGRTLDREGQPALNDRRCPHHAGGEVDEQ